MTKRKMVKKMKYPVFLLPSNVDKIAKGNCYD